MTRDLPLSLFKTIVTVAGAVSLGVCLTQLSPQSMSWGYLGLLMFAILVAPRISLAIPRSNIAVSFSDALIFLSFLMYGAESAVVLATLETVSNCYYNKWKGNIKFGRHMIVANASVVAISTSAAYLLWHFLSGVSDIGSFAANTRNLISTLGILALIQFCLTTGFAAVFRYLRDGTNLWVTWKRDCFSSSLAQIVGAGIAGIVFKIINYGDLVAAGVAMVVFVIVYLTYRQSISDINTAIEQVEEAERQKAETERDRRREAERHAGQLTRSLEKEEMTNAALRKSEQDFQYAALHDSLTNLANRKQLGDILRKLIKDYKVNPAVSFHVLFIDIRRFKNINDSLGHTIGDKVLMIAAKRFVRMLTEADHVARIGGDEFAIILRNLSTVGKAQKVARRIFRSISQPFSLSGNRISISVNIGIAPCDAEYNTPEEILRDADIAMHYAREKDCGVAVFSKDLRERFLERARFEMDLRHAIDRDELRLNYQPIVSLQDGHLIGFEALLRWHHSEVGLIPPVKFIPIAEDSGLITPITVWILGQTCNQLAKWQKISPASKDLIVSVNISGRHLEANELIDDVELALENANLDPRYLKLEFTESVAMENAEHTINILNELKKIGVQLSIDDFGTGYSSLSYLHRLPFDTLKIDRSFVNAVGETGENSEVLQTIISLAKNLKMRVIAEGIETISQLNLLRNLGCDYGQGYLISKPKPIQEAEKMIYERPDWLPSYGIEEYDPASSQIVDANLPVF